MALSVRMEPLLERELELAARKRGITKSQFVIDAVERALGRKNAYELMVKLQEEEERNWKGEAFTSEPYDPVKSKQEMFKKLRAKHGVGRTD